MNIKTNYNEMPTPEQLYGHGTEKESDKDCCTVYKTETANGTAVATRYKVMPGVELYYNDFHLSGGGLDYHGIIWLEDVMTIEHCRVGRFQCEFPNGDCTYLGPGDLAVKMLTNEVSDSWFPLAHFHGISINIEIHTAGKAISNIGRAVGHEQVDLLALSKALAAGLLRRGGNKSL